MEEEEASGDEQSDQDGADIEQVPSVHVSPLPVVDHHDGVGSQNDADDEDAPETSQSVDPAEPDDQSSQNTSKAPTDSSHNTSRVHSRLDDSLSRDDHAPPVCRNCVMDLSRRGLTNIDRKFRKEYGNVRKLIISMNRFHNVSGLDMFKNCVLIDATGNQLHKLSSFLPLARQLKSLLLSNNEIKEIDNLRSFINLENLELAHNGIERIPSTLDNRRLSRLDLSSNALTSLPDLSKLTSLANLDVSSNSISSFKHAVLPKSLLTLNVSYNEIDDLTEFMRLLPLEYLESISLDNNPCVSNPAFDYRIYILSVLPSLQDIDGFVVSEEQQMKGEWLYSQGKGRTYKPDTGAHLSLVKYLERVCPYKVEGELVCSLNQSVIKAMEKRREMLSSSAHEDESSQSLSIHSPYRAWTAQLEGKENRVPSSSADESEASRSVSARAPASSTPARQQSMTSRLAVEFEPPSRSSTMESVESSSTVTLVPAPRTNQQPQRSAPSVSTTARTDRSERHYLKERIVQLEQDSDGYDLRQQVEPRGSYSAQEFSESERSSERSFAGRNVRDVKIQRVTAKPKRPSPSPVVTDISVDMGHARDHSSMKEHEFLQRLMCLEERFSELCEENENLTRINDQLSKLLVDMTNKFKGDIDLLRDELDSLRQVHHPDPCNLRVARELSDGCYEIVWDLPMVKGYKVLTNGTVSGIVRAPNNAARISDVEAGMELSIQVQAIHYDGTLGEPSNPVTIRGTER